MTDGFKTKKEKEIKRKRVAILIVDDDSSMTETLADILSDKGFDVDVAENGFSAIEMAKIREHNVALIDIRMPGIDGIETLKRLKQIDSTMKVILMTAYSVEDLAREGLERGALDILRKPFEIDKLLKIIERVKEELSL